MIGVVIALAFVVVVVVWIGRTFPILSLFGEFFGFTFQLLVLFVEFLFFRHQLHRDSFQILLILAKLGNLAFGLEKLLFFCVHGYYCETSVCVLT